MFTDRFATFSFAVTLFVAVPIAGTGGRRACAASRHRLAATNRPRQPAGKRRDRNRNRLEDRPRRSRGAIENAGQADLDQATQLKVTADGLADLNTVIDKLDSAIEKGLDNDNQDFAKQLLTSTLLQRATLLSAVLLDKPLQDPRRDPRWMQVREFALTDSAARDRHGRQAVGCPSPDRPTAVAAARRSERRQAGAFARSSTPPDADPQAIAPSRCALRGACRPTIRSAKRISNGRSSCNPTSPITTACRRSIYYGKDKFDLALADIDQALEARTGSRGQPGAPRPDSAGPKRLDDALATFNKAGELAPQAVLPYQHRGEVYRRQGDLKKAVEQLTKALEMMRRATSPHCCCGPTSTTQLKDDDQALEDIDTVIRLQPQLLMAHLLKAEIYALDQARRPGHRATGTAGAAGPNEPRLLEPLATYYLVGDQPRQGIETFSKVLSSIPTTTARCDSAAMRTCNIGKHAEAIADFDRRSN